MQSVQNNLFLRPDTFFGVCEALGEDLRIPSNLLRIAVAGLLFWNPLVAVGVYAAASVVVAISRWLYPSPTVADAEVARIEAAAVAPEPVEVVEAEPVALAA